MTAAEHAWSGCCERHTTQLSIVTHLKSRGEAPGMHYRLLVAAHDGIGQTLQQAANDGLQRRPGQCRGFRPCGIAGLGLVSVLLNTMKCSRVVRRRISMHIHGTTS